MRFYFYRSPVVASRAKKSDHPGLLLGGSVIGKYRFRIRQEHIAVHLAPLMTGHALGAAKLDLVLRCVALLPQHKKKRAVGQVLPRYSWEQLHDLARSSNALGNAPVDLDPTPSVRRLKRKWVGEQLVRLEELNLLRRTEVPGKRPMLIVLRDDGSGKPLDDLDGKGGKRYVTVHGSVISSGVLRGWGTPELSAYLAAMFAERYDDDLPDQPETPGTRSWFRPLGWFADSERRFGSEARMRIPFSVPTLERGVSALAKAELLSRQRIDVNPRTGKLLKLARTLYTNKFDRLEDPSLRTAIPADDLEPVD